MSFKWKLDYNIDGLVMAAWRLRDELIITQQFLAKL